MSRWKLIVTVVLAALAIIVVLQNTQSVETKVLFITIAMPRAMLLLVTLLIGFVLGVITAGHVARKKNKEPQ